MCTIFFADSLCRMSKHPCQTKCFALLKLTQCMFGFFVSYFSTFLKTFLFMQFYSLYFSFSVQLHFFVLKTKNTSSFFFFVIIFLSLVGIAGVILGQGFTNIYFLNLVASLMALSSAELPVEWVFLSLTPVATAIPLYVAHLTPYGATQPVYAYRWANERRKRIPPGEFSFFLWFEWPLALLRRFLHS